MHHVLGLLGAGCILFATSWSHAQCAKDTDCKGERVCEAGQCTAPVAPPAAAPVAAPVVEPEPVPAPPAVEAREREPASAPAPKMQRRSTGMMVGGIVMVSLAPVALIVAGFSGVLKLACSTSYNDRHCDDSYNPVIYGSLLSSVVLVGVGVPLLVVGAKRVPVDPAATATIGPWVTPRAAGLGLRIDM